MQLKLTRPQWDSMRGHVQACLPLEGCGLLAGKGDRVQHVLPIANQAQSPIRFRMDPAAQIKAFDWIESNGLDLVGIFHSHPTGPQTASATDIAEAAYAVVQIIWSRQGDDWQARGFWVEDGRLEDVQLVVAGAG
jgi:proteasome lid subunit RPN8/RPN11